MDLILLRHGKAEDFHCGGDFARALLAKGREQSRSAASLLKAAGLLPDIVLTSPLIRARQTAQEFCETAGLPEAQTQNWLACGMRPETAMVELAVFSEFKRIAIVGHEPDFSGLVEWLVGAKGGAVDFKKGALACVRIDWPARQGQLLFLVPPRLVAHG